MVDLTMRKICGLKTTTIAVILFAFGHAQAGTVEVGETGVTFVAPDGFGPMPKEWIELKWPNRNGPRFVVGNERASTTIAYDVKPIDLSTTSLETLKGQFEQTLSRVIPGIQWKSNKVIQHAGQEWVYLEMTSSAVDTDVYNIIMMTGIDDQTVVLNFNSTREDFPKYEDALRKTMNSIRIGSPTPAKERSCTFPDEELVFCPPFPPPTNRDRKQGFVKLSYTVQPDGTVTDTVVLASNADEQWIESTVATFTLWRYRSSGQSVKKTRRFSYMIEE